MATNKNSTVRLARAFFIALRAEGIPELPARFLTKQTIDLYAYNAGRNRRKRALELFAVDRAQALAADFKNGARVS